MTATLSSRGQMVIPQTVRERCQLRAGDHFVVEDNPETQVVTLRKVKDHGDCPSLLNWRKRNRASLPMPSTLPGPPGIPAKLVKAYCTDCPCAR